MVLVVTGAAVGMANSCLYALLVPKTHGNIVYSCGFQCHQQFYCGCVGADVCVAWTVAMLS